MTVLRGDLWRGADVSKGVVLTALVLILIGGLVLAIAANVPGLGAVLLAGIAICSLVVGRRIAGVAHYGRNSVSNHALTQAVLECLPDAVVVFGADGTIETTNPAVERVFGCHASDLIGQHISVVFPNEERVRRILLEGAPNTSDGTAPATLLVTARKRTGEDIALEARVNSVDFNGRLKAVVVFSPTDDGKMDNRYTEELIRDLERTTNELDKLAYVTSHDLKAPLRVIDNASKWLAEDLAPHLTDDTRESLAMLQGRVARMERLLDALLELSRIGRMDLDESEVIDGSELAREVVLSIEIPAGMHVYFDTAFQNAHLPRSPLNEILHHLVGNAVHHHDEKRGEVVVSFTDSDDHLTLRVSDDGPGIPAEYREKVFEVFQTLKRRDEFESCGMGLAIVRKHAQVGGGSVMIENSEGRGTTVRVEWPTPRLPSDASGQVA